MQEIEVPTYNNFLKGATYPLTISEEILKSIHYNDRNISYSEVLRRIKCNLNFGAIKIKNNSIHLSYTITLGTGEKELDTLVRFINFKHKGEKDIYINGKEAYRAFE